MQTNAMEPMDIMRELEPTVEANLNRHLSVAQEWMPHEYVPWRAGPRLRRRRGRGLDA